MSREGTITVEDARIIFRNFTGAEGQYNRDGDRNFCLILEAELADQMTADGWNVKRLKSREEGEPPTPYIQVAVSYKGRPPTIVMITSRGRTKVPEDMLMMLDWVDIKSVDLIVRPYHWTVRGESGVKGYLDSLYMTIQENKLELKYADVPEISWESAPLAIESGPDYLEGEVVD